MRKNEMIGWHHWGPGKGEVSGHSHELPHGSSCPSSPMASQGPVPPPPLRTPPLTVLHPCLMCYSELVGRQRGLDEDGQDTEFTSGRLCTECLLHTAYDKPHAAL